MPEQWYMEVLFTELRMPFSKVLNSQNPGLLQDYVLCLSGVLPAGY